MLVLMLGVGVVLVCSGEAVFCMVSSGRVSGVGVKVAAADVKAAAGLGWFSWC